MINGMDVKTAAVVVCGCGTEISHLDPEITEATMKDLRKHQNHACTMTMAFEKLKPLLDVIERKHELKCHMTRLDGSAYCGVKKPQFIGGAMSADCTDCLRWACAELQDVEQAVISAGQHDLLKKAAAMSARNKKWREPLRETP